METASGSLEKASESGERPQLERQQAISIPIAIFSAELGTLESVTKYLKENRQMRLSQIAAALNRDTRTIWGAYSSGKAKKPEPFPDRPSELPVEIFSNRDFGMLESVVLYLRESQSMTFAKIAAIVRREYSTVWTACSRARAKRRAKWQ